MFLDVQEEPPVFQSVPIASGPVTLGTAEKRLVASSIESLIRYLYTLIRPLLSLLQAERYQLSQREILVIEERF